MPDIKVDAHLKRAAQHRAVGSALQTAANEQWAAVCYFYSAYHLVRYSLRTDPIFSDPPALQRIHPDLYPDLRDLERHKGRAGKKPREWGINELVLKLYPAVVVPYNKLHQASIAVRYQDGLGTLSLDRVAKWSDEVWQAHENGPIRAVAPPPRGTRA